MLRSLEERLINFIKIKEVIIIKLDFVIVCYFILVGICERMI